MGSIGSEHVQAASVDEHARLERELGNALEVFGVALHDPDTCSWYG